VNPPPARTAAAAIFVIAAVAVAGCGDDVATPAAAPAPAAAPVYDPTRTQDFVPLTTAQVTRRAMRIALVVSHGSRVVEGMPGTPFTRTAFTVQDTLKGRLPHTFAIEVIGGRLGDRFVTSPVQPFANGRRYILFLGPDGRVGPTIYPQSVIDLDGPGAPRLHDVLAAIHRSLKGRP
jgi:hypothetical protein